MAMIAILFAVLQQMVGWEGLLLMGALGALWIPAGLWIETHPRAFARAVSAGVYAFCALFVSGLAYGMLSLVFGQGLIAVVGGLFLGNSLYFWYVLPNDRLVRFK